MTVGLSSSLAGCSEAASESGGTRPPAGAPVSGRGGSGGRSAQTLTLSPGDVSVVRQTSMVDGVAITGNLRPIETVDVRARLEGDLEGVFAREGDYVRAGQLLARFESSEQASGAESAVADRAAAQGDLATAQWSLTQNEELFKAGAIAEGEVRVARNAVSTARARLAAANSRVRTATLSSRDTRVLAPTSGTIDKRFVERGEHISNGGQLFSLVRNDVLELAAAVPENQASTVAPGQRVQFFANGRSFEGRVARLSPTVDPVSRSVTVYVQIPNATGALKGGTFATGTVLARTVSDALVVPVSAVRQSVGDKRIAYRIVAGLVDTATVQVGIVNESDGMLQILSGLAAGDSVVSGNVGSLGKGMKVQILGPAGSGLRGSAAPTRNPR